MDDIVVLDFCIASQEEDHCDVEKRKTNHFEVDGRSENREQHQEDDDEMTCMFVQFW